MKTTIKWILPIALCLMLAAFSDAVQALTSYPDNVELMAQARTLAIGEEITLSAPDPDGGEIDSGPYYEWTLQVYNETKSTWAYVSDYNDSSLPVRLYGLSGSERTSSRAERRCSVYARSPATVRVIATTTYWVRNYNDDYYLGIHGTDQEVVSQTWVFQIVGNPCTLTYAANGGSGTYYTQDIMEKTAVSLYTNRFSRDGYVFKGWNTQADGEGTSYANGATANFDGDTVLYAQWVPARTICFQPNGGEGEAYYQTVGDGISTKLSPNNFTYSNHVITHWNTSPDGDGTDYSLDGTIAVSRDTTLYAQWRETCTVTFLSNGGTGEAYTQTEFRDTCAALTENMFRREHYLFTGWNTSADGTGTAYGDGDEFSFGSNTGLYAQWVESVTVTLDARGGSTEQSALEFALGSRLSLPAAVYNTYTFIGWFTKAHGGEQIQVIDRWQDITLYAHWYIATGTCGDAVTWALDEDGTLFVSGTGDMADYMYGRYDAVPWYAYRGFIRHVVIEEGVTSIGSKAFELCSALEGVEIPGTVARIYYYAFDLCGSLTDISMKEGLESIYACAFRGCTALTTVALPRSASSLGEAVFEDCASLTHISLGNGVSSIPDTCFKNCKNLSSIIMDDEIMSIGESALEGCASLEEISFSNNLRQIKSAAFKDCAGLKRVQLEKAWSHITEVQSGAFEGCSGLESIVIPGTVKLYGSAFQDCSGLREIVFQEGIEELPESLFAGCAALDSVTFPLSLLTVGQGAFADCAGLRQISYAGTTADWNSIDIQERNDPLFSVDLTIQTEHVQPVLYTAFFRADGGSGHMSNQHFTALPAALSPNRYFVEGMTFNGWQERYYQNPGDISMVYGKFYADGETITLTRDVMLYACWSVTVSFDPNGGEGEMEALSYGMDPYYRYSCTFYLRDFNFARSGCHFTGWNTAADGSGTPYGIQDELKTDHNLILYAQWEEDAPVFSVSFDANGGNGTMEAQKVEENTSATLKMNAFTRPGYIFEGWSTESGGDGTSYADGAVVTLTGNLTLYAQWAIDPDAWCAVSFDANEGQGNMASQNLLKDSPTVLNPNTFTRYGYLFDGWSEKANGGYLKWADGASVRFSDDMVLYAQWKPDPDFLCSVYFDSNYGQGDMAQQHLMKNTSSTLNPNTFTRPGYFFLGWNTEPGGDGTSYADVASVMLTSNLTLYAQWIADPDFRYYITFDANGGEGVMEPQSGAADSHIWLNPNAFIREGYAFIGWDILPSPSEFYYDQYYPDQSSVWLNSDLKFYAQWKLIDPSDDPSGKCGEQLFWTLDDFGVLTISGSGEMYEFDWDQVLIPWMDDCDYVSKLVVGPGVTNIADDAFTMCLYLHEASIPSSVSRIGKNAFAESALRDIELSEGLVSIGDYAFADCYDLKRIVLPDTLQSIGEGAFIACSQLQTLYIPQNMQSIDSYMFAYCKLLTDIYYSGDEDTWTNLFTITDSSIDWSEVTVHYNYSLNCTVSFLSDGGEGTMQERTVGNGSSIILPECGFTAPGGKKFKAWSINGTEYEEGAEIEVSSDLIAVAVWENLHNFSEAWSKDAEYHWHDCTDADCSEVFNKAAHIWDAGSVTTPATYDADGVKTYTCTACGQAKIESIPKLSHNFSEAWSKDAEYHWHDCTDADCSEVFNKATHIWDAVSVTTPATYDADGVKTYTCTVCGQTKTESIPQLSHHFSEAWSKDAEYHWHDCTDADCSVVSDKAAHTWDAGTVTTPATYEAEGVRTYTCAVCGQTRTEVVSKLSYAGDVSVRSIVTHNNTTIVEVLNDAGRTGKILVASYDTNGRFLALEIADLTVTGKIEVSLKVVDGGKVCVFIVDDLTSLKPLCSKYEKRVTS